MIRIFLTLYFLLTVSPSASAATDNHNVTIAKTPATVDVRSFDPAHRPKDMPALRTDEAAVTESSFACAVEVEVESKVVGDAPVKTKIVALKVKLSLEVKEWVPKNTTRKIRSHEDGHRQISEAFFENADKVAAEIAKSYIGKELTVKDKDSVQPAIKKAATEFCQQYLGAVEKPSQTAQEKYDEITDHGRNKVPEPRAIQQAIEAVTKQRPAPTSQASR